MVCLNIYLISYHDIQLFPHVMLSTHRGCEQKRWDDSTHSGSCVGGAVTEVSTRKQKTSIPYRKAPTAARIPNQRVAMYGMIKTGKTFKQQQQQQQPLTICFI